MIEELQVTNPPVELIQQSTGQGVEFNELEIIHKIPQLAEFSWRRIYRWQSLTIIFLSILAISIAIYFKRTSGGLIALGIVAIILALLIFLRSIKDIPYDSNTAGFFIMYYYLQFWLFMAILLDLLIDSTPWKWVLFPILFSLFLPFFLHQFSVMQRFFLVHYPLLQEITQYYKILLIWQTVFILLTSIVMVILGAGSEEYSGCFIGSLGMMIAMVMNYVTFDVPNDGIWKIVYLICLIIYFPIVLSFAVSGNTSIPNTIALCWVVFAIYAFQFIYYPMIYFYNYLDQIQQYHFLINSKENRIIVLTFLLSFPAVGCLWYGLAVDSIGNIVIGAMNLVQCHMFYVMIFGAIDKTWNFLVWQYYFVNTVVSSVIMTATDLPWIQFVAILILISLIYILSLFPDYSIW